MLASKIIESLDETIDPCDDFYQFTTGGWTKKNPLPKSKGIYGSFNEVQKNNQRVLLDILKRPIGDASLMRFVSEADKAEHDNLEKLQTFFNSCLDENYLTELGASPLLPIIDEIRSLFPANYPSPDVSAAAAAAVETDDNLWDKALAAVERIAEDVRTKVSSSSSAWTKPTADANEDQELIKKDKEEKLTKVLAYLHAKAVDALFSLEAQGDIGRDPKQQMMWLYQAGLGLPSKEYYDEPSVVQFYTNTLSSFLGEILKSDKKKLLTANAWPSWPWPSKDPSAADELALIRSVASSVVAFEAELSKAGADPEDIFDPDQAYNVVDFDAVSDALPIKLNEYVAAFAPRSFPVDIVVTSPDYVKRMRKIVVKTEDHILQAYFLTQATLAHAKLLGPSEPIRLEAEKFTNMLSGVKQGTQVDREEVCLARVAPVLGHLAGAEFIKEAFGGDSKANAENIIQGIIETFKKRLETISWMDKESSEAAIGKASAIVSKIGYPLYPNNTSPTSLKQYYARQKIEVGDFFGNVVRANEYSKIRMWQVQFGNHVNPNAWEMNADTVNAYFEPSLNEIVFPAGILQPPFFSADWPAYLRYGAFGSVAAHELAHAFDNTGAKYDDEGFYRQWWTNSTVEAFGERAQCIADQYSKFYVLDADGKKVYVKGKLTNGEAIGDSGLRIAYAAWQNAVKASGQSELKLPGLDYTPDQLFFLAFGRVWAQNTTPASIVARVRSDPHAPNQFRVEGTLQNFERFAEVFQCKAGSRMNPVKKCALW